MAVVRIGLLGLSVLLAASCSKTQSVDVEMDVEVAPAEDAGDAQPLSNYKSEQKRLAMRGLKYDSGRVEIDAAEAVLVVEGADASQAEEAFQLAHEKMQANRRWEGVGAMTRAVLLAPEDARMYAGLGDALLLRRLATEAEAAYRTAIDLNGEVAEYYAKLANSLAWQGLVEPSIASMQRSLELDPQQGEVLSRLAIQHYYAGDYELAWAQVHAAETLGQDVPPQFRVLLADRSPEPQR